MMKRSFCLLIAPVIFCTTLWIDEHAASAQSKVRQKPPNMQTVEQRLKKFHDLLNEQWEYTLRTSPEFASILGDKRYNDKLSDFSQAAIDSDLKQSRVFLQKFTAIDTNGFSEQEQLNHDLMMRNLREQ